jgi:2'-5' RNA ligase
VTIEPAVEERSDAPIRAFVAIPLDAELRRSTVAAIARLRESPGGDRFRWARPETLHVTLRFLGDIDPARVPGLGSALRTEVAATAPFALTLGALDAFPSLRRPRAVFLHVGPAEPLAALAAAVERAVVTAGFAPELRPFRPHLTLGRARRGRPAPVTASVTPPGDSPVVAEIVLYQSRLGRSGATHTPLDRIALGAGRLHHP